MLEAAATEGQVTEEAYLPGDILAAVKRHPSIRKAAVVLSGIGALQQGKKTFGSASRKAGLPGTGDRNFFRLLFLREASHQLGGCGSSKPSWTGRQPDLGGGAS